MADLGEHMEIAEKQTQFLNNDTMVERALQVSKTVYALLITKTEGKALSLVSLVPRRHGLEAWRLLKEEYEGRGGNRTAALLRGILNPGAKWERMQSENKDIFDMLAAWEKDLAQYRMASGTDLHQTIQVATVMEHAPERYRDLLRMIPLKDRESYAALRAYLREWCLTQRSYDHEGGRAVSNTASTATAGMDIGQVKGKGKEKGKKGKGKYKGKKGKHDKGGKGGKGHEQTEYFAGECGYCGKWGHKRAQCKKRARDLGTSPGAPGVQAVTGEDRPGGNMNQVRAEDLADDESEDGSLWVFAVSTRHHHGESVKVLVDSGADEHVCPRGYASLAATSSTTWGTLYDAQGNVIKATGTRTVYLRLGPESQLVSADVRVTDVQPQSSVWGSWSSRASSSQLDQRGARWPRAGYR